MIACKWEGLGMRLVSSVCTVYSYTMAIIFMQEMHCNMFAHDPFFIISTWYP